MGRIPDQCCRGHSLTQENIYVWSKDGSWKCRICHQENARRHRQKGKEATAAKKKEALEKWLPVLTPIELAWAAGLFEGEGTVTITNSGYKNYTRALVSVTSTDFEIIDFFQSRWPAGVHDIKPKSPNHRPARTWFIDCSRVGYFVQQLLPFIRTRRVREKMELLLESESIRVQGSREPGYRAQCQEFKHRMRKLNRRGVPNKEIECPSSPPGDVTASSPP
jgi:hypothetical protein